MVRHKRRRRPVCKLRGRRTTGACTPARGTVLEWKDGDVTQHSTSLVHVLVQAAASGAPVRMRVHAGSSVQWNDTTVRRLYGASRVRVRRADGRVQTVCLKRLKPAVFTTQAPWATRIVKLRVLKVVRTDCMDDEVRGELLRTLATTQHGGKALLKVMGFEDMEVMWAWVPKLEKEHQRERARGRLSKWTTRMWGVSLLARPQVRVPMSNVFPRAAMQRAVDTMFRVLGDGQRPEVKRLRKRTRFVSAQPQRVGDSLCNWRPWCKNEYVPGVEPACTCKGLSECKQKENMLEGHLAMRGSSYRGDGWRALHCSAKTEMSSEMEAEDLWPMIRDGLRGLVSSLPARVREEAEGMGVVQRVMHEIGPTLGGFNARRRPCVDEPTVSDVQAIQRRFDGQVISEIDKARGELAVL